MKGPFLLAALFSFLTLEVHSQKVIADHTIVDKFKDIPQAYIDKVKAMWVSFPGESHSEAYRAGCNLLEGLDSKFQVNVTESGNPEPKTNSHLRISRATWGDYGNPTGWIYSYGEEDWFTNATAISRTKSGLSYCHEMNLGLAAIGFAWCYDGSSPGVSGSYDPVYQTRWGGESVNGPEGNRIWGLDAEDSAITGNSVCLDTYLNVTKSYAEYCNSNNIPTKIIFTTGPVDNVFQLSDGEVGYQQYLKYKRIRDYVNQQSNIYFIDFADILSYNNAGQQSKTAWKDKGGTTRNYPIIHDENYQNLDGSYDWNSGYHFGPQGALKIAKAVWWILARMAGWDGGLTTSSDDLICTEGTSGLEVDLNNDEILIHTSDIYFNGYIGLYNLNGCLVQQLKIDNSIMAVNKSRYTPGLYFVVVAKENSRKIKKILIIS